MTERGMRALTGIGVSPGIVTGPVYLLERGESRTQRSTIEPAQVPDEVRRFRRALAASAAQIRRIRRRLAREVGEEHTYILDAHLMMLRDRMIVKEVIGAIRRDFMNAEWALEGVIDRFSRIFKDFDNSYLSERVTDIEDIGRRILNNLTGASAEQVLEVPPGVVVIARDLSPSDTAQMQKGRVLGFATDMGGKTSHTAIMARSLEIPAIVGIEQVSALAQTGDVIIIDGNTGQVYLNPDAATVRRYEKLRRRYQRYDVELVKLKDLPAETRDGHRLRLEANIELPTEVPAVLDYGADGIGLYRTEFIYLNRDDLPDEEEHYRIYRRLAEGVQPRPATIRTFDLGGDKFLSRVSLAKEMNPALGLRAIRFCLREEGIFKTQLAGILRASAHGNLEVMFPLVSELTELLRARELLDEVKTDLERRGEPYDRNIRVGAMIETPAAALIADILAPEVDFFSIGTNDLIQYALAIDRVNEHVAYLYRPLHPAVLRIVRSVAAVARDRGIPVGMCGEMAGEAINTLVLMGLGIEQLSMNAFALPRVKKIIRSSRLEDARRLAGEVAALRTPFEVEEYVKDEMLKRFPEDISDDGRQICLI